MTILMAVSIESFLFFLAILFFVSLLASKAGSRLGIPVLLLFLSVGMLFGIDGFGIEFSNYKIAQSVGTIALCIILFSGGMDTKFHEIKPVAKQGAILATIGVLLTALFTGLFIYYAVNTFVPYIQLSLPESLLLASIMSSTDSASVFSILRGKGMALKHRLRPMLELESGSNDPMAYMLTIILIDIIKQEQTGETVLLWKAVVDFFLQLTVGGLLGYILGKGSVKLINSIRLGNDSLYPILLFSCGIFTFAATYFLKGNGFLAIYISGLIIGNAKFIHKRSSLKIFDGLRWFSQIIMFLTLGLLVNPGELGSVFSGSILIAAFIIILGRPLSVFASLLPFPKMPFKDKLFVSWVGLRGAVPIIFAIYPLAAGIDNARMIFNIVFFITLISLLVQGTTIAQMAKWLGLTRNPKGEDELLDFDVEFSEEIKSTMTEISISQHILSTHGNKLMNLPLPEKTLAVMVKRGNSYFVPKGQTELQKGDKLLVITDDEKALVETYENLGIKSYTLRRN